MRQSSEKTVEKANTPSNFLMGAICSFCQIFVYITIFILTLTVLVYSLTILMWYITPRSVPVDLGNGFIYAEHPGVENDSRMLTDRSGNVLVQRDIQIYEAVGKTVYGSRKDSNYNFRKDSTRSALEKISFMKNGGYVYFICTLGKDCSKTQNYHLKEIQEILKQRGLPPYTPGEITNLTLMKAGIKRFFDFGVPKDFSVNTNTIHD